MAWKQGTQRRMGLQRTGRVWRGTCPGCGERDSLVMTRDTAYCEEWRPCDIDKIAAAIMAAQRYA
jgi:hypothetical protein